jgi:glutamyl-tRNA reductase
MDRYIMANRNSYPLAVVGCDFRTAPARFRSRLVLDAAAAKKIGGELAQLQAADGFADLNTCNRNEWILSSHHARWAAELMRTQMKRLAGDDAAARFEPYAYTGKEAARHVFRVAIGQESLVVGERQIAGQVFSAFEAARLRGTSSRILNGLGSIAGRLVRMALRRGWLESDSVGVHSLAIAYLEKALPEAAKNRVAVVGLGSIGRRVLGLMEEKPHFEPVPCNRTVPEDQRDRVRPLAELGQILGQVDAAIVCTGAPVPVVQQEILHHRGRMARQRPLWLVDLGIPEQIGRFELPGNVHLVRLDELVAFHRSRRQNPPQIMPDGTEMEALLQRALIEFKVFCNSQAYAEILDTVQRHHQKLVSEEIPRIISGRLSYLPEVDRARLETDLKSIILEYTTEVFRTIRESSSREGEENSPPV